MSEAGHFCVWWIYLYSWQDNIKNPFLCVSWSSFAENAEFFSGLHKLVGSILREKERHAYEADRWLSKEAARLDLVKKAGTFRCVIEAMDLPSFTFWPHRHYTWMCPPTRNGDNFSEDGMWDHKNSHASSPFTLCNTFVSAQLPILGDPRVQLGNATRALPWNKFTSDSRDTPHLSTPFQA